MNILVVADIVPYPPNTGIKIRTYNIIKQLSNNGQNNVYLYCFNHRSLIGNSVDLEKAVEALSELCVQVKIFEIETDRSPVKKYFSMAWNYFQRVPHRCIRYFSSDCERSIKALLATKSIDIVHLDKTELGYYYDVLQGVTVVCTNHNIESKLMLDRVRYEQGILRKKFALNQAKKLARFEKFMLSKVDGYITCTDEDKIYFQSKMGISTRHVTVDNGVDISYYHGGKREGNCRYLLIVGAQNLDSTANFDATHFFMKEVWPKIRAVDPDVKVKIVGRNPDKSILSYQSDFVDVVGFVDDERTAFRDSLALIVPIRVGGGSRLKILVGMAMQKAIVSTSIGAEGIHISDKKNILIADEATSFARSVLNILQDEEYGELLGANARKLVVEKYDWDVLGRRLLDFYGDLIDNREKNGV